MPVRSGKEKEGLSHILFFGVALVVFLLDQWTKLIISRNFSLGDSISIVDGLFSFSLVHNTGTAFGFFKQGRVILIGTTLLSIVFLICFYFGWSQKGILGRLSLGLVFGGALGNLMDRLTKGYVIDFLDFYVGVHHWPAFNIADSAITVGVFFLMICFLRNPKNKRAKEIL
jgi:signal peptidase II